eukprot:m.335745 g.335745  ORF g.335745 m.335745 type:complete len:135 (+) comp55684_c0_seq8:677-1081(+)
MKANRFAPERDALIICGDHNNDLTGSLRALLLEGKVDAGFMEKDAVVTDSRFTHPYYLVSAYEGDPDPTFVMPPHSHYRLDHITFTPETLTLVHKLRVLPDDDRAEILQKALPSSKYPSDHMPIGVLFRQHTRA